MAHKVIQKRKANDRWSRWYWGFLWKGVIGGLTGFFTSEFGSLGNGIIKNKGVIGRPVDYGLKTYKNEFEGGTTITGTMAPNLKQKNNNE